MAPTENPSVIRIRPKSAWRSINLVEAWEYRDVLIMLALRDIKLRYKQTAFGVAWVILQPLVASLVMALIFGRFARLPSDGKPYMLFVFSGMLGWNLFAGILQRAGNSLVAETKLITKVYFPRLLIPLAGVLGGLVDFLVSLFFMLALMIYYHSWPGWWIALLPFVIGATLIFATGMSFWISALNVRYRDFVYALPFVIQIWMYASPVVYSLGLLSHDWQVRLLANPMTGLIEGFRLSLLGTSSLSAAAIGTTLILSIVTVVTGAFYFRGVEKDFADRL